MAESAASKKWEEVQKKAFTHWVNSTLAKRDASIEDLETGFASGVNLITMVEVLSGKKIPTKFTKSPKLIVHKINNCFIALKFVQDDMQVKGVTVSAEDIVNGRLNLILGFCWLMLRSFHEPVASDGAKGGTFEGNLLQWVKETLVGKKDIDLSEGYKSSCWSNGKALLALVDVYDPSILNGTYSSIGTANKLANCERALGLAEQHVKLPGGLIEPSELADGTCSEKNLVLYLSLFYNSFKDKFASFTKESLEKSSMTLRKRSAFTRKKTTPFVISKRTSKLKNRPC